MKHTRLQARLVLLLITMAVGMSARAQETPSRVLYPSGREDCPGNYGVGLFCLAQLEEQPQQGEYQRRQVQPRKHDRLGPPDKQRKFIEQFRLLKLLELLDLGEDQEIDFITAFHSMRRERRSLYEKRTQFVSELADGLRDKSVSDSQVNRLIEKILRLDEQERELMGGFLEQAREILTPQQLGKFLVFQERFEFQLLEAVRAFRERDLDPCRPGRPQRPAPYEFDKKDSFEQRDNF